MIFIMPEDTSITATYYTKRVLTQVKSVVDEQRPKIRTSCNLLLHGNAAPSQSKGDNSVSARDWNPRFAPSCLQSLLNTMWLLIVSYP